MRRMAFRLIQSPPFQTRLPPVQKLLPGAAGCARVRGMKSEHRRPRHFGSDNYAGICPEAFAALTAANADHATSYGDDPWTARANQLISQVLGRPCEVFFVFSGTAANSLALAALCQSYHGILCHQHAHVEVAECSGPEFFTNGAKLLLVPGEDGKMTPDELARSARRRDDVHYPRPKALSLTQATEMGTVYTPAELRALTATARELGLRVHLDGARLANAVAALGVAPGEITGEAGVDVLSFGLTKNGLAVGEAVVFFDPELARDFGYRRKQAGQLASKLRFLSAPWVGMLEDGAWLRHAAHANSMAARLAAGLRPLAAVEIAFPVQTNVVFARMAEPVVAALHGRGWHFYTHVPPGTCRLMCSWDTTAGDVDEFVADVREVTADGAII